MKRTKTFVTKFLSVLAVGAIVLSSCTKDLEDRMDKVEETLNVVVKNVADLQKQLEALENAPEMTVVGAQDPTTGVVTLTFTNPAKVITFNGADGNTNDAAKVEVVEDAATNTTTVGIKQPDGTMKNFTYPTTIPSNITSIVTLTNEHKATAGTTFDVNFFFNTNDGKAIPALAKTAISVIEGQVTKSAIVAAENITVNKITPVEGSKNEFTVTFNAIAEATVANYRIGVAQTTTNTIYSELFDVTVGAAPIVATIGFGDADATAATISLTSSTTPVLAVSNSVTSPVIKGKEFFATGTPAAIGYSSILDRTYEVYKVKADGDLLTVVTAFNVNATKAKYDVIAKAISDDVAKPAATSKLIAANDHIMITSDKGIVTITPDYTKVPDNQAKYFVVMKGRVAGGNYFIVGGIITTNKAASYIYTPAAGKELVSTYGATDGITLTAPIVFEAKTYPQLTGLTAIPTGVATYVDVYSKDGKKMNVTAQSIPATLNTQNFMEYTFKLDNTMSLVNGETYTVNVKHVYNSNPEKFFIIQHSVTVKNPTVAVAKQTTAALGFGYDYAASKITLDSHKAFTNTTEQTLVTFTNVGDKLDATKAVAVTVKNGTVAVGTNNYKIFYRIKTTIDGEVVYFDKLVANDKLTTVLTPSNVYIAAEVEKTNGTVAAENRIAMDKEYDMDIVVVYTDGNREVVSCKAIYNTAKIVGFKAEANTITIDKLAREINIDASKTLDLSYVKNATNAKPFFFATDKNTTALWIGETKPTDSNPFIKMFNGVVYTIAPLTAEQKAKVTKGDVALTEAEATALISLISFPTGNAQDLSLSDASGLADGVLKINVSANGLTTNYKLTADLVQTITATVTDYYGRTKDLTIEVTIKK